MIFVSLIVDMQPCSGRMIVGSEGFQIHENWCLDGPKIVKNRGLEGLGAALGAFWQSLAKLWLGILRKLSLPAANIDATLANHGEQHFENKIK